jgi:ABC-type enterochelin transport system substrate-binding protein
MPHKPRHVALVALAAIAIAGCGSSGSALSKAGLVAKADPICKQVSVARDAANAALSKTSSSKQLQVLARIAPAVAAAEHQAVDQLRALKAPAALAANWQQMLNGMQQLADDTARLVHDAKANDIKAVEAITSSGRVMRQHLTVIANHIGFTYCGRTS